MAKENERSHEIKIDYIKPVSLKGSLLGHQIVQEGKGIETVSLLGYPSSSGFEDQVKYSAIYFRTKDGDIFQMLKTGEEADEVYGEVVSARDGEESAERFDSWQVDRGVKVGKLLNLNSTGTKYTPVVTEIVGVVRDYSRDDMTEGVSSIIEDFENELHKKR